MPALVGGRDTRARPALAMGSTPVPREERERGLVVLCPSAPASLSLAENMLSAVQEKPLCFLDS